MFSLRNASRAMVSVAVAVGVSAGSVGAVMLQTPVANAAICLTCGGDGGWTPPPTTSTPTPAPTPAPTTGSPAPHGRVQLILQTLYCYHTTELGHDEVYYRLGGTDGSGKSIGTYDPSGQAIDRRAPSTAQGADADNGTAWDLNDSGDVQNRQLNAMLDDEALQPGQVETLYVALAESDGTNLGALAKYGATAVGTIIGGPTASSLAGTAGTALASFIPANQDDFLGNFGLQVQNNGGSVSISGLSMGEYANVVRRNGNTFTVHVQHDDGSYDATFLVQGL